MPYISLCFVKLPCEIIVTQVFPQVRALVATELKERYELRGKTIAGLVGTTEAAVSQYLHGVRAVKKDFLKDFPEIHTFSKDVAKELYEKQDEGVELTTKLGNICKIVRGNERFEEMLRQGKKPCNLSQSCIANDAPCIFNDASGKA